MIFLDPEGAQIAANGHLNSKDLKIFDSRKWNEQIFQPLRPREAFLDCHNEAFWTDS